MDAKYLEDFPVSARLEWRLSGSRLLGRAIETLVHPPRIWWHSRTRVAAAEASALALAHFERKVYSQQGEDGIIAEIFRRLGTTSRYAVEFGMGDGTECCTRRLFEEDGFSGLLMDGGESNVKTARALHVSRPQVQVVQSFITAENILELFRTARVPADLDLLVVDIDGNDYWVLERILSAFSPRVIVAEYNARWVPPCEWVMRYDADHVWDGTAHFGASLTSLTKLADAHGYALVGCDSRGVNAFFVRKDCVADHFPDAFAGAAHHYAPPRFGRGFGHPIRMRPTSRRG